MPRKEFTVTAADLDAAIRYTESTAWEDICATCLLAVALTRSLGEKVSVGCENARFDDRKPDGDGCQPVVPLPGDAVELIDLFDIERWDGLREMLPLSFYIDVPEQAAEERATA